MRTAARMTVILIVFLAGAASAGPALAVERVRTYPGDETPEGEMILRASVLMGMQVENTAGDSVAEIDDIVLDAEGRVRMLVLEIGDVLDIGGRRVAVDFGKFGFVTDWFFREQRMVSGVQRRKAVGTARKAVYSGTLEDLRQRPEYDPMSPRPGGEGTGWGIYSAPPGPSGTP